MKKLILDYSKWRCGGEPDYENAKYVLGKGYTALENKEGYLCCLGQFSLQLDNHLSSADLIGKSEPQDIGVPIELLTTDEYGPFQNSTLSGKAMSINDEASTTTEKKIELLKELFAKENYEIEVINKP